MINDWTETPEEKNIELSSLPVKEQELLKDCSPSKIKLIGRLDHSTLEAMIVGYTISLPSYDGEKPSPLSIEKIIEAEIKKEWFEDQQLGAMFEQFLLEYRERRHILSTEDVYNLCLNKGYDVNQASMYKKKALECKGAIIARNLNIDILIERFLTHHLLKTGDSIYSKFCKERADPQLGPRQAWQNMRESCVRDLLDPRGAVIKSYDIAKDSKALTEWLVDMKHDPDKYKGAMCGINAIDTKTLGFRSGQLTVFVGYHGGFKTTTMMNVAYGLYERGHDVLYGSLEMEAQIVQAKLLSRATRLSYSRLYNGGIVEPEDWVKLEELQKKMVDTAFNDIERGKFLDQYKKLNDILSKQDRNEPDLIKANKYYAEIAKRKNRLVIVNVGQSQKMKLSQLERWLYEQSSSFKPQVVILDYLDLMQPEILNPDRLDVGYGDICKMSRAMGKTMGFAPITAAQMKRAAVERLRKTGMDSPEKAQFGTDDISGSGQIGADADNVFVLWKKDGNKVMLFPVKSRYAGMDNSKGDLLEVDHDSCTIGDDGTIQGTDQITNQKTYGDAIASAARVNNPTYTIHQEDIDDEPSFFGGGNTDTGQDEIKTGPGIAPTEEDKAIGDL